MSEPTSLRIVWRVLAAAAAALLVVSLVRGLRDSKRLSPAQVKREAVAAARTRTPSPALRPGAASALAAEPRETTTTTAPPNDTAAPRDEATAPTPKPSTPPQSPAEACAADWSAIVDDSEDGLSRRVEQGLFTLSPACREAMARGPDLHEFDIFLARCSGPTPPPPEGAAFCVSQSTAFRAALISRTGQYAATAAAPDYSSVSMPSLVGRVGAALRRPEQLTASSLDALIAMSEEATSRDPDLYDAYKARLVGLLLKETRFGADVPVSDYTDLMDQLNAFRVDERAQTAQLRRDATAQLDDITAQLDALAEERQELRTEIEAAVTRTAGSKADLATLLAQDRLIEADQQALWQDYRSTQAEVRASILRERQSVDSDLVRLPFVRLLAKGELAALAEESSAYIEENPDSPLGYFFQAQAEWRAGDRDAANATITQAIARGAGDESLGMLVERDADRDPADFVDELARSTGQLLAAAAGSLNGE